MSISDMHGKIALYAILTVMMVEHFDTNTDDTTNNYSITENLWSIYEQPIKSNSNQLFLKTANRNGNNRLPISKNSVLESNRRWWTNTSKDCKETSSCNQTNFITYYGSDKNGNCLHMPTYMTICPPGLHEYPSWNLDETLCYTLYENQIFPPRCPYSHPLPYHSIKKHLTSNHFKTRSIWLNAMRNTTSGFAHFEWRESGLYFGRVMEKFIANSDETINKNCLVFKHKKIFRVSCSETHDTLCMYSINSLSISTIKSQCTQYGFHECIVSDFDLSPPKCFCKKIDFFQPEKYAFCKKLAEPIHPFQSELMLRFAGSNLDPCWIGLYKSQSPSKMYKWWSTKNNIEYTRWAMPEECEFSEGAFKFDYLFNGWYLTRDRALRCALCEVTLDLKSSSLELEYKSLERKIQLTIYNFASINTVHGLSIYCFSDASPFDFKKVVPIMLQDNSNSNYNVMTARLLVQVTYPGYYWCELFQYSSMDIIKSNTILAYNKNEFGHEFSLNINMKVRRGEDAFINKIHVAKCKDILKYIITVYPKVLSVRPMRAYFNEIQHSLTMLVHITTKNTSQSADTEYEILYNILKDIPSMKIIDFRSSEACLTDFTSTADNETLIWPETRIGASVIPINTLCLDSTNNMLPVIRRCNGDFLYGAKWDLPIGDCLKNTTYSDTTEKLFNLTKQDTSANNLTTDLLQITQQNQNKQPIDVHLISVIVEDVAVINDEKVDCYNFSNVVSNIMKFNKDSAQKAQRLLNSTDKVLSALDDFIKNKGPLFIVSSKLIIYVTTLETNGVGGIALYNTTPEADSFKSYKIINILQNASFEMLLEDENLETAVLLPTETVNFIKEKSSTNEPLKLIIMVFYNDLLFTEQESNVEQHSKTKIISVAVPGFKGILDFPIKVAFKMPKRYSNTKNCSHWSYGLDSLMVSVHGKWKSNIISSKINDLLEVCEYFHMTHFGLLLQGFPKEMTYGETVALEILTAIGSALSLIGIIPIFLTAVAFKTWRCRPGNIILISFCLAITIQIILMFSMNAVEEDGIACQLLGAGIHYTVLSEFCWMFIIALLQYKRFVLVFEPQNDNIVRNCLLVGWCSPLIPVVITVSISTDNYAINEQKFCTVAGYYYIFGYLLPIIAILISNVFIFANIVYNVSRQNVDGCAKRKHNYKLEILLALFLFFALGMTWIFGIIGAFGGGIAFTYLFCIFATLRGLVLFLFFIVGNKETRLMWNKRYVYYLTRKWTRMGSTPSANTTVVSSE